MIVVVMKEERVLPKSQQVLFSVGCGGLQAFFLTVVCLLLSSARGRQSFLDEGHHTRGSNRPWPGPFRISHRAVGAAHFACLVYGSTFASTESTSHSRNFLYDVLLGLLGIATTWTAAGDFPHRHVRNRSQQSGTLSEHAIVTQDEMMEHLFYQALNLLQALYLHVVPFLRLPRERFLALAAVSSPWLIRNWFPVHPFSQNWKEKDQIIQRRSLETFLYRIKKWQYLLYKHVLLHGTNLIACLEDPLRTGAADIVHDPLWRLYWVCLNSSYVMEFFLQSMVKRRAIEQSTMLFLNRWLMIVSTLAASVVVWKSASVPFVALCASSLAWNVCHRKHDFAHTMALASVGWMYAVDKTTWPRLSGLASSAVPWMDVATYHAR